MDVREFLKAYDALAAGQSTEELETLLKNACLDQQRQEPEDRLGISALYNELGTMYRGAGRMEEGEQAFLTAKQWLEPPAKAVCDSSVGCSCCAAVRVDLVPEPWNWTRTTDYATILNNLAGLYRMWNKPEQALKLFDQAGTLYDQLENVPADLVAGCCNNKGLVYLKLGLYPEAMSCFREALERVQTLENKDQLCAITLSNMAFALAYSGHRQEAREFFLKAARLADGQDPALREVCLKAAAQLEPAQ